MVDMLFLYSIYSYVLFSQFTGECSSAKRENKVSDLVCLELSPTLVLVLTW